MYITERYPWENGRDYAVRIFKDNIVRLELEPGSMISDKEVAAELKLSRTPVREALLELSKVKIVEIYPQRGSVVSLIDYGLVEEARFVRSVLEVAVVELACAMITPEFLEKLENNVKLQLFYQQNQALERMMDLDDEFHKLLFQSANKMQAYELMRSMMVHFDRVRSMALTTVREQKWLEDHRLIFEAVRDNDPAAAKQHMDRHLKRYQIDEEAIYKRYPHYFK